MTQQAKRKRGTIRLRAPYFPSVILVCLALFLWIYGPDSVPLLPWLCLMSLLVTARHIFFEAKFPALFTWFAVSYIGLFLVYPIVAPLLGIEMLASDEVFVDYCFLIVTGLHLFIIGYELASPHYARRRWDECYGTTSVRLFNMLCLFFILNIFASLLVLADAGSLAALTSRTRDEMKFGSGILSLAGIYVFALGAIMYPLLAIYCRQQRFRFVVWLPAIVGLEIFIFLMFRTRTFPVIHAIGLLTGWFLIAPRMDVTSGRASRRLRTRLTFGQKLGVATMVVVLMMGMLVLRVFRGSYENADSIAEIEIDMSDSIQFAFEGGGELGYSKWVFKILELVPEHHQYLHGQSYYRLLFVPIPRTFWPGKPQNSQLIVAQWINPGVVSVQTTPVGIIGDLYVNFGMLGILGMAIFGFAFGRFDRARQLRDALFLAVSFAMVFHMARGAFTNPLLELLVCFVTATLVANYLCRGVSMRRASPLPSPTRMT